MKILLLGSGGREHAFAKALIKSPTLSKLWVAPGNAGTAAIATNVPLPITDFDQIAAFITANEVNLLLVGPEEPLVLGLRNYLENAGCFQKNFLMIGPNNKGAALEGSKDYAKQFLNKYKIPTAGHHTFTKKTLQQALVYLGQQPLPIVLKADGLAAGKGVLICHDANEAAKELIDILNNDKFGTAGKKVVVENFMRGIELSVFVAVSGSQYLILPSAKDYKRIGENDTGANTGGMGAVSPAPFADEKFMQLVQERIVEPTIQGLLAEEINYQGFLFIGLMSVAGNPNVIEYNVRMGDPETEVVLPRIESDFLQLLLAIAQGTLNQYTLSIKPDYSVGLMAVANGYPNAYTKGKTISINPAVSHNIVHAGTQITPDNTLVTNGGRVLLAHAMHPQLTTALQLAYQNMEGVRFEGMYYRKDIGKDLLPRAKK